MICFQGIHPGQDGGTVAWFTTANPAAVRASDFDALAHVAQTLEADSFKLGEGVPIPRRHLLLSMVMMPTPKKEGIRLC